MISHNLIYCCESGQQIIKTTDKMIKILQINIGYKHKINDINNTIISEAIIVLSVGYCY